jgi:modulator of FtsH protease
MAFDQNGLSTVNFGSVGGSVVARNRVLRNTYLMLALSLVPTVVGAWLGMATGLASFLAASPMIGLVVCLVGAFGLMFAIERNKHSSLGVGLLLVFTLFMGLMLSRLIGIVLGLANGATLIMTAFGGTAIVFGAMATIATVAKRDFSGLQKFMTIGFLVVFVSAIANIWLQLPALMLTLSVLIIGISSVFMLISIQRVINGGETNYVSATLAIYINLYNIFSNLLALLGIFGGDLE